MRRSVKCRQKLAETTKYAKTNWNHKKILALFSNPVEFLLIDNLSMFMTQLHTFVRNDNKIT